MKYLWKVPTEIESYSSFPATRYLITAGGGYFPILDRMPGGKLSVVVREGDHHVGQRGYLGFITSDDGGESWSETTRVVSAERDPCHVAFGCTREGTLLVSYVLPHSYADGAWDRSVIPEGPVYLSRSDDGGTTWNQEEMDTGAIDAPRLNPYGRIVQLPDDTLLMPIYVSWPKEGKPMSFLTPEDRTTGSFILRSRDDGRTWGDATLVSKPVDGETSLVRLSSGKLLAALRRCYPDAEHDTWLSDSDDDGYTWSAPRRVTGHMQHPADLVQLADGRILLVFGHRRVPFGVRALISRDEGKSWDHDNTLVLASESIDRDCGYPSVVQLDDGQIVVAYYVHHGLGPFVNPPDQVGGPYAAAVKFQASDLP